MQVSAAKTKACRKATISSSAEQRDHHEQRERRADEAQISRARRCAGRTRPGRRRSWRTCRCTTWPPIMLPNSRIDSVTGRTRNEMNSIGTTKSSITQWHAGRHEQLEEARGRCGRSRRRSPIRKVITARVMVTASCEVTVNWPGTRPQMFSTAISEKSVKT